MRKVYDELWHNDMIDQILQHFEITCVCYEFFTNVRVGGKVEKNIWFKATKFFNDSHTQHSTLQLVPASNIPTFIIQEPFNSSWMMNVGMLDAGTSCWQPRPQHGHGLVEEGAEPRTSTQAIIWEMYNVTILTISRQLFPCTRHQWGRLQLLGYTLMIRNVVMKMLKSKWYICAASC